jgi:hypothetical protein
MMDQHKRMVLTVTRNSARATDFQIGDRIKLAGTDLVGVVIGKSYGDVRYEVRREDGVYLRELLPEALRRVQETEQPPTLI